MPAFPRDEMEEMMRRWVDANDEAGTTGDWSKMSAFYTEDALYTWNNGDKWEFAARGVQQIHDWVFGTEIEGLEDVFGGTDGDDEQKKKGKALKNQLTVRSRFFSVKVTTGETAPRKEFSFLLKRGKTGGDPIPVLLWEERERPPLDEEEEFP